MGWFCVCVCDMSESCLHIASMQLRAVLSRAKCENGASSKIVLFVTGRMGVIDVERENEEKSVEKRAEGGQQHSVLWD